MPAWSRTQKPDSDTTKLQADIYGVDQAESVATPGITQPGWVHRRTVGSRVIFETLVAMKNPPTDTVAGDITDDDAVLPDV